MANIAGYDVPDPVMGGAGEMIKPTARGLGGLGGLGGQIGNFMTGQYTPQAQMMGKVMGQDMPEVPGWAKMLGGIQSMGGISYQNGRGGYFSMNPGAMGGGGPNQSALLSALMAGQNKGPASYAPSPITMKNQSVTTDLAPDTARLVNPAAKYREGDFVSPQSPGWSPAWSDFNPRGSLPTI